MDYRSKTTLEERIKSSNRQIDIHPDCIPVIIECEKNIKLSKYKLMAPKSITISYLLIAIRKQMLSVRHTEALFLYCDGVCLMGNTLLEDIYNKTLEKRKVDRNNRHKHDMFMYINVCIENTFGFIDFKLQERYNTSLETVKNFRSSRTTISTEDQLSLYGLYKRITVGMNLTDEPPFYKPRERAKWRAWKAVSGYSKNKAMQCYVDLVNKLYENLK